MGKKKAEQADLPGVEQPKIAAIERAAKKYESLKEPFAQARDTLKEAKGKISKLMHDAAIPLNANDEKVYRRGDVKVVLKHKESIDVSIGLEDAHESEETVVGDEDEEE